MEKRRLLFDRLIVNYKNIEDRRIRLATLYLDQLGQSTKNQLSLRNVASFGGLSFKMLYISVNNMKKCLASKRVGRPRKMDEEGLLLLDGYIRSMEEINEPPTKAEVAREVQSINFKLKPQLKINQCSVSKSWVFNTIKSRNYSLAIPMYFDPKSSIVSEDELNNYILILDHLFLKYKYSSNFIFNCDESWINPDTTARSVKVVTSYECKRIYKKRLQINKHLTFLPTISSTGKIHRGFYIWPYKKYDKDIIHRNYNNDPYIQYQRKGWMDENNFFRYMSDVFIPTILALRNVYGNERALLILDSHSSRYSFRSMQLCVDNEVDVVTLPAHSTQYLQPLDVIIFSLYKHQLSTGYSSVDRYSLLQSSELSISEVATPSKIRVAFNRAGFDPYSHDKIRNAIPKELVQSIKKKKFTLSGNLLTSPEILEKLLSIEQSKANILYFVPKISPGIL